MNQIQWLRLRPARSSLDDVRVHRGLRVDETLQIEGVACRFHMTYGGTVVKRRMPKARDLAPLIGFRTPRLDYVQRRLDGAQTIDDLRRLAKRRTPKAAFDYTDGAAEEEISLQRARQAFRDIEFHPTILRDVSNVRTGWQVLGGHVALPFAIAPTGFTRLMHTEGELAGVRVAAAADIPFSLSTLGTASIEDVAAAAPQARKWFQLYMWRDRDRSMALVQRAAEAGFDTLLATVDVPVAGARLRDLRNGMSIPPALTLRTTLDAALRPRWWIDLLTTEPLSFASLDRWSGTVGQYLDTMFDPSSDLRRPGVDQSAMAGQAGRQGHSDPRRCACRGRLRRRRHRVVQSRWPPTRSGAGAVPPAADGGA